MTVPPSKTYVDGGPGDDCVIIEGRDGEVTIHGGPGNDSVISGNVPSVDWDAPPNDLIEQPENGCGETTTYQRGIDALADNPIAVVLIVAVICATLLVVRIMAKFQPKPEY